MATSAWRDLSSGGVAGAGRAVATQSDGGSGSELAMLRYLGCGFTIHSYNVSSVNTQIDK